MKEAKIKGRKVFDGVLLQVYQDEVRLPDGKQSVREWIDHPGASAVIPLDRGGRITLVQQFRYPLARETLEIPAGKLDPGESPMDCAKRELLEETGLFGGDFFSIGSLVTTPAFTNEKIHLFLAKDLDYGEAERDSDEFITTRLFSIEEVFSLIAEGRIIDAKTTIAFLLARQLGLI